MDTLRKIAGMRAEGWSDSQIAAVLGVSEEWLEKVTRADSYALVEEEMKANTQVGAEDASRQN